jgi:DNA-binding transcriptional ArsR family regulator
MYIVDEKKDEIFVIQAKEISDAGLSPLAMKILHTLKKPAYPKEIAKKLGVHEQKVYYHIRKLEEKGMIKVVRKQDMGGTIAKYYALSKPSFFLRFGDFQKSERIPKKENDFFSPFILDGVLNAKIVVGSPDPHGPEKARSRDLNYAIEFALFLGTFLKGIEQSGIMLDIDMRSSDMKENLIVIGGPVINSVTKRINEKMAIRFDSKKNIYSSLTKKTYRSDECGLIVKFRNPYDREKFILVIAGKRASGTRAGILAFLKNFEDVSKKSARVVEGIDEDFDGIVDKVRILE